MDVSLKPKDGSKRLSKYFKILADEKAFQQPGLLINQLMSGWWNATPFLKSRCQ
jgi:hypothetical protein